MSKPHTASTAALHRIGGAARAHSRPSIAIGTRSIIRAASVLAAVGAFLAVNAGAASAAISHPFEGTISGGAAPNFGNFVGIGVGQTSHQVYAFQNGSGTEAAADAFDPTSVPSTYLSQFAHGFGNSAAGAIAADEADARVYVTAPNEQQIFAFNPVSGAIDPGFGAEGVLTIPGSSPPISIAVEPKSGDLYVAESGQSYVAVYTPSGVRQEVHVLSEAPAEIAFDSAGDLYVVDAAAEILKYSAPSYATDALIDKGGDSVAVDQATGDVYVGHGTSVIEYNAAGTPIGTFGQRQLTSTLSLSVDETSGRVYVSQGGEIDIFGPPGIVPDLTTGPATNLHAGTATLTGAIDPDREAVAECFFEYGETTAYGQKAPCAETVGQIGTGNTPVEVHADLTGLHLHTAYHYRLVAKNANGENFGDDQSLLTAGPAVTGEVISELSSTTATAGARLDANGADTHYRVQYGTTEAYGSEAPTVDGGSSYGLQAVTEKLVDLQPSTLYHYRFVAVNIDGEAPGPDRTFTTYALPESSLPDGRVYEQVSPVDKEGAGVYSVGGASVPGITNANSQPFQSASNGNAVTYTGQASGGGNGLTGNQYLARRDANGWNSTDISPPTVGPSTQCPRVPITSAPFAYFSSDLSGGVLTAVSNQALPAGAPNCYASLFQRDNETGRFRPLMTAEPSHRTPLEFGFANPGTPPSITYMFAGASTDLGKVVLSANDALTQETESVPAAVNGGANENNIYLSEDGKLSLINVLPNGTTQPNATVGARPPSHGTYEPGTLTRAVSADGSRIFWTDLATNNPTKSQRLFLREDNERTVQLDAPEGAHPKGLGGGGLFWTASTDGSKVFFTDDASAGLTEDTVPGSGSNLYEYDVEAPEGERLTDLTVAPSAGVDGVVGASADGSYVYFVAGGILTGGQENSQHAKAGAGPNLYLRHGATTTFIATLVPEDNEERSVGQIQYPFPFGAWRGDLAASTGQVTPDGRHLVFQSLAPLTGYDNTDVKTGEADFEIYLYSADANELTCASCNPTGQPPLGPSVFHPSITDGYQPRWVSDDGSRVFFDSLDRLVPNDTNENWDVYEYENGQIHLISDGTSPTGSYFDESSPEGKDVFFTTRAQLVAQDKDQLTDLYDARVDGGFPQPTPPCVGSGCQAAEPPPPAFTSPSSSTLNGPGNQAAPAKCKKGFVRKAVKCVKQKQSRHHKKSKKKSHKNSNRATARKHGGQK